MKLLHCEILGTSARTLAPLANFPRALACNNIKAIMFQMDVYNIHACAALGVE